MKRKAKSLLSCALCVAMVAGTVLTGCGNSGGTDSKKEDSGDKKVITFYGFSDWVDTDPYKSVYQDVKAQFEKENPGYEVELQSDPWGDWEQKNKTMFASGNVADVFYVGNDNFPTFANSGNLLDLDQYVEDGYFDDFFENVKKMYQWEGKSEAIPFTTDCRILWYNKEIFKEAGLDPENPPKTWDELRDDAKQITEKTGKYGFGMDLGLKEIPTQSLICASDYSILNVADDGTITSNVKDQAFKDYLKLLSDMKDTYEPDFTNLDHHDVAKQFAEGQFGMIIGNNLSETDIYDKDFWGQALVPTMTADSPQGSFGGGFGIGVNSKTKYPEQAVKFAQMLCDPQYNGDLVSDIPASNAGAANCAYAKDDKYAVIMDQIQYVRQAQPKTLYFNEVQAAVYDTVANVIVGGQDIDSAVDALDSQINDIVKQ
ncbi:MAG: sugar ABC transporter substrate-binding protein [Hespellia sp.]|nr:sugar ABC transporter substrate-binding protein [Hespellia sp.]